MRQSTDKQVDLLAAAASGKLGPSDLQKQFKVALAIPTSLVPTCYQTMSVLTHKQRHSLKFVLCKFHHLK